MQKNIFKAVIFDMDGVLIDSEPFWMDAENYAFGLVGIKLTKEMKSTTMGLREDQVVDYWYRKFKWEGRSREEVLKIIIEKVIELVKVKGEPMRGVHKAIGFFKKRNMKIALASSSFDSIIKTVIKKLKLEDMFDILYSAEYEKFGKPHPGVYLTTAKRLKVKPGECICVEDSLNGLKAALNAGMKCIAVPSRFQSNNKGFSQADAVLNSLDEIDNSVWELLTGKIN